MDKSSVKNPIITLFTLLIIVFLSACSEMKINSIPLNQRDIVAVNDQGDPAEIYIQSYSIQGLEEEDFFAIQNKGEYKPLKRQLKNPVKVYFSNQQVIDTQ